MDCGGRVKNVSIKHRIYGRITVPMDIASRQDIEEFLALLQDGKSTLLSNATAGYHYHLIEAASAERRRIKRRLTKHKNLSFRISRDGTKYGNSR